MVQADHADGRPQTNSLLLLYGDAQSIYGSRRAAKFSFKSVGIQAQGRTTILRVNYRNTNEILESAYRFAEDIISPEDADEDGIPLVKPEMAGRHGAAPRLFRAASLSAEAKHIAQQLMLCHANGTSWKDMAVLYHAHFIGDEVASALEQARIPYERLAKGGASRKYKAGEDSVKLMTMHSSKGLEFPVVAIAGLGFMPSKAEKQADDARLLYVAMTRATDTLFITASKDSMFVKKWQQCDRAV